MMSRRAVAHSTSVSAWSLKSVKNFNSFGIIAWNQLSIFPVRRLWVATAGARCSRALLAAYCARPKGFAIGDVQVRR